MSLSMITCRFSYIYPSIPGSPYLGHFPLPVACNSYTRVMHIVTSCSVQFLGLKSGGLKKTKKDKVLIFYYGIPSNISTPKTLHHLTQNHYASLLRPTSVLFGGETDTSNFCWDFYSIRILGLFCKKSPCQSTLNIQAGKNCSKPYILLRMFPFQEVR